MFFEEKVINQAILDALEQAKLAGVSGKESTPFLLSAIGKITDGKSLLTSKNDIQVRYPSSNYWKT